MADSNLPKGVSFSNTPQARDDLFSAIDTGLNANNLLSHAPLLLNVMGNDLGGNGKSLYSIDSGSEATTALEQAALITQDAARAEALTVDRSAHGAKIWITADGQIGYDASTLNAGFVDQLQHIGAGQYLTDTFTYAIRLGNGTLSWATATVQIAGLSNHAATITGTAGGTVVEDGGIGNGTAGTPSTSGTLTVHDVDAGQAVFQTVPAAALAGSFGNFTFNSATGQWSYTLDQAKADALTATDVRHETLTVASLDGTATQLIDVTVQGSNDAASITGTAGGTVVEDGTLTTGGTLNINDVDTGEAHFQTPGSLTGTYGTFSFDAGTGLWGYALNNGAPNVQALIGTDVKHDTLTVTSADGTASQVIDVAVHGQYDLTFVADGTVDPSATKASSGRPNEIINGSGIPASHFGLANVTDAGIQFGMQVIYRQGPVVTTSDDYADGVLHFLVNEGPQSVANGSQADNANRAAWSFDYSIATGLNGQSTNLSNYTFKLLVDVDPSAATSYHTLEMVAVPAGTNATGFVWIDDSVNAGGPLSINGHPIVIGDDSGNAKIAQNSENYSFGFIQNYLTSAYGPSNGFAGPAHFDLVLQAYDTTAALVTQDHVVIDVNSRPVAIADDGTTNPAFRMTEDDGARAFNVRANDHLDQDIGAPNNVTLGTIAAASNTLGIDASDLNVSVDGSNNVVVQLLGSDWQKLAGGQNLDVTIPYTLNGDQPAEVSSANLTVRISGVNDAPHFISTDIENGQQILANDELSLSGNLLFSDVDLSDTHTVEVTPLGTGYVGDGQAVVDHDSTGVGNGSVFLSYHLTKTQFEVAGGLFVSQGGTIPDEQDYLVTIRDNNGLTDTHTISVPLAQIINNNQGNDNQSPMISGGNFTGTVTEDLILQSTGQLTAFDPDPGTVLTWSVEGGSPGHVTQYHVTMDDFHVTKVLSGTPSVIFDDPFTNTNPPNGPNGFGTYLANPTAFTNANGRVVMDSANAGTAFSLFDPSLDFTGQPTGAIANAAILNSNIDPSSTLGLKAGSTFTVTGTYDLLFTQASYGIRLQNTDPVNHIAGNDVVDLALIPGLNGSPSTIQFNQIDFAHGSVTPIASVPVTFNPGDNQIVLNLAHVAPASGPDAGLVTASFTVLHQGTPDFTVNLSGTGLIFQNGQNWTRPGFEAVAPGDTSSFLNGIYGALAVNQNGGWTYLLHNSQDNVQALGANDTAIDHFVIDATDEHGAFAAQPIDITVHGTNDAPTVVDATPIVIQVDTNSHQLLNFANDFNFTDVDLNDTHTVTWVREPVSFATPGSAPLGTFSATFLNDSTHTGHGAVHWSYSVDPSTWPAGTIHHEYFDVIITDPSGAHTQRTIDIDYENLTGNGGGGNQAPETLPAFGSGPTNTPIVVGLSGTDSDGTVAGFRITSPLQGGTLYSDAAGTQLLDISHDIPATNGTATVYFVASVPGSGSFSYASVDNAGAVDPTPASASITVTAGNQAPTGIPDSYSVGEASNLVHTLLTVDAAHGVLQNDFDPDNGPAAKSAHLVSNTSHGLLTFNADGSFSYAPDPYYLSFSPISTPDNFTFNYSGPASPDSFTYQVFDGTSYSAPTTVSIAVVAPPELLVQPWNYDMQHGHDVVSEPMGGLYDDLSGNGNLTFTQGFLPPGATQSLAISAQAAFTVTTGSLTYWVSGQNFTYGQDNVPTGGTIVGIQILNPAVLNNPSALPQTLLNIASTTVDGQPIPAWNVNAADFVHALQAYSATHDRSGLDAIFQDARYETIEQPPLGGPTEVITGGPFADDLRGAGGNVTIYGGAGNDRLAGNGNNAQLSGGDGADTFEFGGQGGHQYINDFSGVTAGQHDVVDLRAIFFNDSNGNPLYRADTLQHVLDRASQVGPDTVLDFSFGQLNPTVITLRHTNIADLRNGDFLYASPVSGGGGGGTPNQAPVVNVGVVPAAANFMSLDYPGSSYTIAVGINDAGQIVGQTATNASQYFGFEYSLGSFSPIVVPATHNTSAEAINDLGTVTGWDEPAGSTPRFGFTETAGTFSTPISVSPGISTTVDGINNAGVFVGSSFSNGGHFYSGFINNAGTVTLLNAPGANETHANGVNNFNDVVGSYALTAGGIQHGYIYHAGSFTTLDDPLGVNGTVAVGINDAGEVVGWYVDAANRTHGFVSDGTHFVTVDDPLGVQGTNVNGINDAGQIVGRYIDGSGVQHGFLASFGAQETTAEDTPLLVTGLSVSDPDAGTDALVVTLGVGHGALSLATTAGLSNIGGLGTGLVSFTGSQSAINGALSGLTYTPAANYNGLDTLSINVNDQGHNGTGGPMLTTEMLALSITPIDDAPVVHMPQGGTPGFAIASTPSVNVPQMAVAADFNGDGKLDLAISDIFPNGNTVSILLGNGTGSFIGPVTYAVGSAPSGLAVADLNHDGKLDLAATNQDSGTVSILLGNGNGSFQPQTTVGANHPDSVVFADVTGDGNLDMFVALSEGHQISEFIGNGNGTFQTPLGLGPAYRYGELAVADLNGDGRLDIVAAANPTTDNGNGEAMVFLGTAPGTFAAPAHFLTGGTGTATSLALGDLNGDGKLDVAMANVSDTGVYVMLGNGDGTFNAPTHFGTVHPGGSTADIAIADFNGDGKADIAVSGSTTNNFAVYSGNGDGTFQPEALFATGTNPQTIATGDFNDDGRVDIVTPNYGANTVSVFLNTGATVQAVQGTPLALNGISVSDVDATNDPIQLTLSVGHGTLSLLNTANLTGDLDGGDGVITLSGSQSAIDAALSNGLSYMASAGYSGPDTLTATVSDLGHNGSGGPLTATAHLAIMDLLLH